MATSIAHCLTLNSTRSSTGSLRRISSFDKQTIADTKRLVNLSSLPPDQEIEIEWNAFLASLARPAAQTRLQALLDRGGSKTRRRGESSWLSRWTARLTQPAFQRAWRNHLSTMPQDCRFASSSHASSSGTEQPADTLNAPVRTTEAAVRGQPATSVDGKLLDARVCTPAARERRRGPRESRSGPDRPSTKDSGDVTMPSITT